MSQQGTLTTANEIETLTGDIGGPVGPDSAGNINILSVAPLTVTGNPGTYTLTIDDDGTYAVTFTEDSGSATPSSNNINIFGGTGIDTSGSGSTVTITAATSVATTYTEDNGSASPSGNNLNILGGNGIGTDGSGSTVTVNMSSPFTGAFLFNGDLSVNGSLDVDNLTLDGNTISSTSGVITLAPLAGQDLEVTLSTTGDFIVNTDDLVVDTSAGFVGIGTASPGSALDIEVGDGVDAFAINSWVTTFTTSDTDTYNLGITGSADRLYVTNLGGTKREAVVFGDTTSSTTTIFGVSGSVDSGSSWVPGLIVGIDGHLELSNKLVVINTSGDIVPAGAGQDLGSTGVPWDSVYVGNLLATGNTLSSTDTDGDIVFDPDGTGSVSITDAADLLCSGDRAQDIGSTTNAWDNIYCDGISFDDGSNTLDDYEEGTWTPGFQGSTGSAGAQAYSGQTGTYRKIGNAIFVWGNASMTNKGSWTGTAQFNGLPFTSGASLSRGFFELRNSTLTGGSPYTTYQIVGSTTHWGLQVGGNGGGSTNQNYSDLSATSAGLVVGAYYE